MKVIKELEDNNLTYKVGIDLYKGQVNIEMNIYKNNKFIAYGGWKNGVNEEEPFDLELKADGETFYSSVDDINEIFEEIESALDINIPNEVKEAFEYLFKYYKDNDFKEL